MNEPIRCKHFERELRMVELHPRVVIESTCAQCGQRVMASENTALILDRRQSQKVQSDG